MRPRSRMTALWMTVALSAAAIAPAYAQGGGGALPAYGEPTIISSPGLRKVFTADFTSNGIPDFATVNGATVTVYPGLGDGTFGAGMTSSGCATWNQALLGDFNGDGTPDIAFREYPEVVAGSDPVGVMFGTGAGTFQPYRRVGALPYETTAAAGDFDGDGRSDLAGAGSLGGSLTDPSDPPRYGIIFLWGRGDGNVDTSGLELDLGISRVGHTLFTADLTGDGKPDLVWKKYLQGKFVVMPGLGGRSFGSPIDHTSAGEPIRFAASDFNADGMRDLAVLYSGGIGILNGNGDGTFQPVTSLGPWDHGGVLGISSLLVHDFDGDTKPDLSIDAAEGVALFVNNGDGTFRRHALTAGVTEPQNYDSPYDYAVADFNADGRTDFVAGWAEVKAGVYLGLAAITTSLAASSPSSTVGQPVSLTATVTPSNLTGAVTFYDGARLLGGARISGGQAVLTTRMLAPGSHAFRAAYGGTLMGAPATLSNPVTHTVSALPAAGFRTSFDQNPGFLAHGLAPGDFDGDGKTDLLATDYQQDSRFGFLRGNGDGTLANAVMNTGVSPSPRFIPRWIAPGDVNLDGKQDFALHNETTTSTHLGNGDGSFSDGAGTPSFARFADLNGDGKPDRVATSWGQVSTWLGIGDRKGGALYFTTFSLVVASHNSELALGDFNGDLHLDLAMMTAQENRAYILLGKGDGTFHAPRVNTVGTGPASPVAADFNGDGKLDLAFANTGSGTISILPGKGDGDFLTAIDTTVGGTLTRMTAADLTGDGKVDLAVLSTSEDRVLVLPGNGNGTFGAARKYYAGTVPMDVVAADFNGDGRMDLAVSSNADLARGGPARLNVLLGVNPAPTSVLLAAVPASSTLSDPVVLTATVSPAVATGWMTFNDGATPLGSVPVSAGQAVFQTRLLGSGVHLLAAVFSGDGTVYGPSASTPVAVHVAAEDVVERAPAVALSPAAASLAAQADFNGDGIVDLIVCGTGGATVLLGVGSGEVTPGASFNGCQGASHLLAADFNRDGKTDLAAGRMLSFGIGDGTFGTPRSLLETGAFVAAADFNGDGAPDLADVNGHVFLNRGAGTFTSPAQLSPGLSLPWLYAVAADLNADGRADLVVPDYSQGIVYVLLAAADGVFPAAVPYPTVARPGALAIADFSGDGIPDLAVGDYASNARVAVMLGLGDGTFENWGDAQTGLNYPRQLIPCDLDGDGNVDLLALGFPGQPVTFLRGLGNGTFEAAVAYATIVDAQWLLLTDLNYDGRPDLVHGSSISGAPISVSMAIAASSLALAAAPTPADFGKDVTLTAMATPAAATGTITFYDGAVILGKAALTGGHASLTMKWLGAGTHALRAHYGGDPLRYAASDSPIVSLLVTSARGNGFGTPVSLATARGPKGIAAGDLNGDGKLDLVVANSTSNTVSVFLGNGTGGFAPRVSYNTGSTPVAVLVADLNDDGLQDVAVACSGSNAVNVLLGNGNGTLQAAVSRGVAAPVLALVAADVNLDQATDLVAGTGGGGIVAAFIGADGLWPASGWSLLWGGGGDTMNGVSAVDLNGDGRVDVAAAAVSGVLYRLLQQPAGAFAATSFSAGGSAPSGLAVGDFNGDGEVDLATPNRASSNAGVLLGNGDGTFQGAVAYATGSGPSAIATADADGDGQLDLVVANGTGNTLTILHGNGDGTFAAGATIPTGGSPAGVVVGDFDGNGITDLAVANSADNTVSVYLGTKGVPATSDFTGDAKSDLLWRHASGGDVWLWPMDGAARTAETFVRTVAGTDWEIRGQGDQNGDGMADLLWRHKVTGQIYFWPMDGATPLAEIYVTTVDQAYDIVGTGDFDGDGKSDILWRHLTNGDLWVWLMDGAMPLSQTYVDTVDLAYVVKGVADLDADGKADIVFHHQTLGEVWVWPMNGATRLSQHWVGTVPDTRYQIVGVADHTGDGKADLLWHHATLGEVWIWTMNGPVRVEETWVGTVADIGYQIAGSGDYNGDGKADILWHHATLGEVWVWLMDGSTKLSETWIGTVPDTEYRIIR